jgi:hypothetical protein
LHVGRDPQKVIKKKNKENNYIFQVQFCWGPSPELILEFFFPKIHRLEPSYSIFFKIKNKNMYMNFFALTISPLQKLEHVCIWLLSFLYFSCWVTKK